MHYDVIIIANSAVPHVVDELLPDEKAAKRKRSTSQKFLSID